MSKPRMMFYHDGRHQLIYAYESPMQKEEYESAVDELAGTSIEALMFCLGDGRTVLHDTKVGELWGHNVDKWPVLSFRRSAQIAKQLIEEGNDPLRVICARARAMGMLIYPTLLVQQGRLTAGGGEGRTSDFRLENTHLEIGAKGDLDPSFTGIDCLDFKHQEVQDERFALIEETLNNYDVDGFELQLLRAPAWFHYFHPDETDAGRPIMTEWVRRVSEAVKRSGPERELAIRIPADVEVCLSRGVDPQEWIRQGIVDVIIGETLAGGGRVDPLLDLRPLVAAAKGSECRIHAAIQSHVDSDRLGEATISMIRAIACNYYAQGVDGLYLSHWIYNWPYQASFYEKLRELPNAEVMAPKDKHYHIPTATPQFPNPDLAPGFSVPLPVDLNLGEPVGLDLTISDDLPRWDRVGRVHELLLRVRVTQTTEVDQISLKLNGEELPETLLRKINRQAFWTAPRYVVIDSVWYVYRLDRDHWPVEGPNSLKVTLAERDAEVAHIQVQLRDVELEVKYLMGKNWYRDFVDADLGAFDPRVEVVQ